MSNENQIKKRMQFLTDKINRWNELYYKQHISEVFDSVYDLHLLELIALERDNPELACVGSPCKYVGSDLTGGFKKVKHTVPMLSIQNALNQKELFEWFDKALCFSHHDGYLLEWKIDGIAIDLRYEDGMLKQAITRGDGVVGDDVTQNAKMINGLPLTLGFEVDNLEVRGEVYLTIDQFNKINQSLEEGSEYKNPRNLVSGTMKLHDPYEVMIRKPRFMAFEIVNYVGGERASSVRSLLNDLGFETPYSGYVYFSNDYNEDFKDTVMGIIENLRSTAMAMSIPIDGIVVKVSNLKDRKLFSTTSKHHNWQIAYKFQQDKVLSRLIDVEVNVGRTGIITPVAIIEPVEILGTTVSRASLHNYSQIKKLGLKKNDIVVIEKGGEIIPKIIAVEFTTDDSTEIKVPETCPSCSKLLRMNVYETEEQYNEALKGLRCDNENCPSQLQRRLEHFVSKHGMNVVGMGESVCQKILDDQLISSVEDIFDLEESDILSLDGFGETSASKLVKAIQDSLTTTLDRFIYALGIPRFGRTYSKKLASIFKHPNDFVELFCEDVDNDNYFSKIDKLFGEATVGDLYYFMSDINIKNTVKYFFSLNPNFIEDKPVQTSSKWFGKTVVITGTLSRPRDYFVKRLEQLGASIKSSVTSRTDFVLVGENPGSKFVKAKKFGTTIITESEID